MEWCIYLSPFENKLSEGELDKNSVTEKNSATTSDGKNHLTTFHNLDAVISVSYCVNSHQATVFNLSHQDIEGLSERRIKRNKI